MGTPSPRQRARQDVTSHSLAWPIDRLVAPGMRSKLVFLALALAMCSHGAMAQPPLVVPITSQELLAPAPEGDCTMANGPDAWGAPSTAWGSSQCLGMGLHVILHHHTLIPH